MTEPMVWQPIETAPKDGSDVLLFFPTLARGVQLGSWSDTKHYQHGKLVYCNQSWHVGAMGFGAIGSPPEPSHWMPLPGWPQ